MQKERLHIEDLTKAPREIIDYAIRLLEKEKERRWKQNMKKLPKVTIDEN